MPKELTTGCLRLRGQIVRLMDFRPSGGERVRGVTIGVGSPLFHRFTVSTEAAFEAATKLGEGRSVETLARLDVKKHEGIPYLTLRAEDVRSVKDAEQEFSEHELFVDDPTFILPGVFLKRTEFTPSGEKSRPYKGITVGFEAPLFCQASVSGSEVFDAAEGLRRGNRVNVVMSLDVVKKGGVPQLGIRAERLDTNGPAKLSREDDDAVSKMLGGDGTRSPGARPPRGDEAEDRAARLRRREAARAA